MNMVVSDVHERYIKKKHVAKSWIKRVIQILLKIYTNRSVRLRFDTKINQICFGSDLVREREKEKDGERKRKK